MQNAVMLQSRRYNAAVVQHACLEGTPAERIRAWAEVTKDRLGPIAGINDWKVSAATHYSQTNFYSPVAASRETIASDDGFVQGLYLLAPPRGWFGDEPCLLVAAPYIRLLNRTLLDFERSVGQPRPGYIRPKMAEAFVAMIDPPDTKAHVARFSVLERGEASVDRVSIAGRNPLRSIVGRNFSQMGVPYDVRVESRALEAFKTNVNLDRHGNLWWYHRGGASFSNVLPVLDLFNQLNLFESTRVVPTSKKDDEDD